MVDRKWTKISTFKMKGQNCPPPTKSTPKSKLHTPLKILKLYSNSTFLSKFQFSYSSALPLYSANSRQANNNIHQPTFVILTLADLSINHLLPKLLKNKNVKTSFDSDDVGVCLVIFF